jgi:WD40 repeat protein
MKVRQSITRLLMLNILLLITGIQLTVSAKSPVTQLEQFMTLNVSENAPVIDVVFSPNGEQLATLSGSPGNQIKIWNIATGEVIHVLPKPGEWGAHHIQFTPDGKLLIANGSVRRSSQLISWDVDTGNLAQESELVDGDITSFVISPDGETLVGGISIFNGRNFTISSAIYSWETNRLNRHDVILSESGEIRGIAFSSDEHTLAYVINDSPPPISSDMSSLEIMNSQSSASLAGYLKLWDMQTEQTRVIGKHDAPIQALSVSPNAALIATASEDSSVKIWNVDTGKVQQTISDINVYSLDFSPDSNTLATSGSWDVPFQLRDVETGELLMPDDDPNTIWGQRKIVFSPNGQSLASGGEDGIVRIWHFQLNRA